MPSIDLKKLMDERDLKIRQSFNKDLPEIKKLLIEYLNYSITAPDINEHSPVDIIDDLIKTKKAYMSLASDLIYLSESLKNDKYILRTYLSEDEYNIAIKTIEKVDEIFEKSSIYLKEER